MALRQSSNLDSLNLSLLFPFHLLILTVFLHCNEIFALYFSTAFSVNTGIYQNTLVYCNFVWKIYFFRYDVFVILKKFE